MSSRALLSLALIGGLLAPASAHAALRHRKSHHPLHAATIGAYKGALLEDADSGRILFAYNADMQWPPASMAKMMLLLVAEDQVKTGRAHLDDPVRVSERAAHTGGSRVGLVEGQIYPLRELMKAAIIKSANDAAVAVAEKVGGSVEATVRMMNARAIQLGMLHTDYQTVDGLPPRPTHDADITTARDLATVARAIINTTELLRWSSLEETTFDNGVSILHNTNHLIGHFEGCDGLKTGFTFEAGFNLTSTARRGNMRLISVILGAPSNQQRFTQSAKLLEWGFDNFTAVSLLHSGDPLPVQVRVQSGDTGQMIQPVAGHDLKVVLRKTDLQGLQVKYDVPTAVAGPVRTGEPLGRAIALDNGEEVTDVIAVSPVAVEQPAEAGDHHLVSGSDAWSPIRPSAESQPQEPQ
ncbi:MAG TPA: D-alanyl-D-alanine carboxypeptidase family protein [Candidatus Binataceae bacterium]|nr:D-alanyl-D-alanine carboxypeptidase family protein [Candidatus Binataceae bacterium]